MLNGNDGIEDLLYKPVKEMAILHGQKRAMGRLGGHAPSNEAAAAQLCSSLSVCNQYTSFKGEDLESILKRLTEEPTFLCMILKVKSTALQ